jgi:hypothetical protein
MRRRRRRRQRGLLCSLAPGLQPLPPGPGLPGPTRRPWRPPRQSSRGRLPAAPRPRAPLPAARRLRTRSARRRLGITCKHARARACEHVWCIARARSRFRYRSIAIFNA